MHEEASSRKSGPCELFALWWRWSRIEPEDDQREVPFAEVCGHVLVRSRRVFFVTVPCLRLPCLLLLFFSLCLFGEKCCLKKRRRAAAPAIARTLARTRTTVQSLYGFQRGFSRAGRRRQIPNPQSPSITKSTTFV